MSGIVWKMTSAIRGNGGILKDESSAAVSRSVFLVAAIWISPGVSSCFSQTTPGQDTAASTQAIAKSARTDQSEPEISYSVMLRLIGADREFNLTKDQAELHQEIVRRRSEADLRLSVLRHYATYPQPRILQAIAIREATTGSGSGPRDAGMSDARTASCRASEVSC